MKFQEIIQEKVLPVANQISANKFLRSLGDGFTSILSVIIIGSIFSLLSNLAIAPYQSFITSTGLKPYLAIPGAVTNDILAIYAVFFIAFNLAKYYDKDQGAAGLIALFSFLAITPLNNTTNIIKSFLTTNNIQLADGITIPAGNVIPYEWIGTKGLFVAIVVGLVSTVIYNKLLDKGIAIKLPDGVPPTVATSFAILLPGFVVVIFFMLVNKAVTYIPISGITGLHSAVYSIIQAPMEQFLGNSIGSYLFAVFIAQLLWFFGIHGGSSVIVPIFYPLWTGLSVANVAAVNAGASVYEIPYIINRSFYNVYGSVGGSGLTLGLCIYMALRAKSKQYKTLGRVAVLANICAINEPIIFALPMVLNPFMFLPWVTVPMVSGLLAYILTVMHILPGATTIVPFGTPIIMSAFISTSEGAWKIALFQVAMVVLTAMIYYPFFRVLDKKAQAAEKTMVEDEAAID